MKKLPEILTSCCIIFGLLTAGTMEKISDKNQVKEFPFQDVHDTTGLVGFIKVDSFKLEIIPPSSGVQFFKSGIVFLSNTKYEGKMLPNHVSFGSNEAYTAIVKDTSLGFHMLFSPSLSFPFPCEALTFSSDFKIMYFTKIAKKEKREKIYYAEFKPVNKGEPGWVANDNPLDFCTGDYIFTHPALSADGNILIFSSDMAGSLGGMDLFLVRKVGEKWSSPINLGKSVNTQQYECFPYLDQDNNLFFSSDGLAGYGGYDIFTCKFNGETWEKPKNLSRRINTENDDIAFSIDKTDGRSAFYTTRQKSGNGEMQLYKVTLKQMVVDNNPLSISFIYNGKPLHKTEIAAIKTSEQVKPPEKETVITVPAEVKKETKVEAKKKAVVPATKSPADKAVTINPGNKVPEELKDVVVYRIQFLTTTKPRKENQIVINGVSYTTYEYFYRGAYRYTVGEFTTLSSAAELQNLCRKSGYTQAFAAAFKNNVRVVD
jgi:hypothetical protein